MRTQRLCSSWRWFTAVAGKGTQCRPCTPPGSRLRTPWRKKPCQRTRCRRTRGGRCPPASSGTPSAGRCC
eukprot:scaffold31058_cov44-Phaeocystis_antarctica.AAC.1